MYQSAIQIENKDHNFHQNTNDYLYIVEETEILNCLINHVSMFIDRVRQV